MGAAVKDVAMATAGEAVGEGAQEVIGGITKNLAYILNEEVGNGHIQRATADEILTNAGVAMAMASTTAMVASGMGASFTAARTVSTDKAAFKETNRMAKYNDIASKSLDEIKALTGADYAEGTTTETIVADLEMREKEGKSIFQYSRKGLSSLERRNEYVTNSMKQYNISRPEGMSVKENTLAENINTGTEMQSLFFKAVKKGDDYFMEANTADFSDSGTGFYDLSSAFDLGSEVSGKIYQGEFGLEIQFAQDFVIGSKESYIANTMRGRVDEMLSEGIAHDLNSLKLSDTIKDLIQKQEWFKDALGMERIKNVKALGVGDYIVDLSNALSQHKPGTPEYQTLSKSIYDWSQTRAKYEIAQEGLGGTIDRIRKMISDKSLARSKGLWKNHSMRQSHSQMMKFLPSRRWNPKLKRTNIISLISRKKLSLIEWR